MLEAKAAILPKAIFGNILSLPDFATILWYRLSAETFLKDFCRLKMAFFLPYKMKLINVLTTQANQKHAFWLVLWYSPPT